MFLRKESISISLHTPYVSMNNQYSGEYFEETFRSKTASLSIVWIFLSSSLKNDLLGEKESSLTLHESRCLAIMELEKYLEQ
jgi:hypothetical protein